LPVTFTPPTVKQAVGTGPLLSRYRIDVGQSVVKYNGVFTLMPFPWAGHLVGLTEGVDYFMGGRTYNITGAIGADLEAAGFTVDGLVGYGEGAYGYGLYGV